MISLHLRRHGYVKLTDEDYCHCILNKPIRRETQMSQISYQFSNGHQSNIDKPLFTVQATKQLYNLTQCYCQILHDENKQVNHSGTLNKIP